MGNIERTPLEVAYDDRIARLKTALNTGMPAEIALASDADLSVKMDALRQQHRGAVLAPEVAAVAATLVDLAKRNLPPHISEAQQVEAYLALKRISGGQ